MIVTRIAALSLLAALVSCALEAPFDNVAAKRIALSFDDAPRGDGPRFTGDERAKVLIDTLSAAQTGPVVFFVKTGNLNRPGGAERIASYAKAGHLIANHAHSHHWLNRADTAEYIADVERAEILLERFDNRRAWFRYPYLDEGRSVQKRDAVVDALQRMEIRNGYVTVDNYDWYLESKWQKAAKEGRSVDIDALRKVYVDLLLGAVEFYDELAVRTLHRSPVHVLLLHENDVGAMFVGDLVSALRQNGWDIVSPDEAYRDPVANQVPETLKTGQGRVAALAIDAGQDPRTLTHLAIEEAQIDELLQERQVFGSVADF